MTTKQIKTEIQKLLDTVPDNVLQDLLSFLKQANKQSKDQSELSSYIKRILAEDRQVLEMLAK